MKRYISIFLVVALLFCCSPIQAHAAASGTTTVLIGAGIAAAAVLTGIGIKAAQDDSSAFNGLVDSLASAWSTAGLVADGMVTFLYDPVSGIYKIKQAMVQTAFDFVVDNKVVTYTPYLEPNVTAGTRVYAGSTYASFKSDAKVLVYCSSKESDYTKINIVAVCSSPNTILFTDEVSGLVSNPNITKSVTYNGQTWSFEYLSSYRYFVVPEWTSFPYIPNVTPQTIVYNILDGLYPDSSYVVADGLQLGYYSSAADIAIGYPEWAAGSSEEQNPDDPDQVVPYWPIGLPASVAGAGSLTQSDVWQGIGDFVQTVPATLDTISGTLTGIGDKIGSIGQDLFDGFERLIDKVHVIGTDLIDGTTAISDKLTSLGPDLIDGLTGLKDKVVSFGQDLVDKFSSVFDLLQTWSDGVTDFFSRTWTTFKEGATSFWNSTTSTLSEILEWVKSLPAAIAQAITSVLSSLFVPDVAEISAAVDTMKARFPFFDSIIGTWKQFQLVLSGGPPVIYAHLENAEGHFNYGGTVAILDMNFYTRYKSIGDAVISAALWAFFAWRTFVKLPGLISGASGDVAVIDEVDKKW